MAEMKSIFGGCWLAANCGAGFCLSSELVMVQRGVRASLVRQSLFSSSFGSRLEPDLIQRISIEGEIDVLE